MPSDAELEEVLRQVRLEALLERSAQPPASSGGRSGGSGLGNGSHSGSNGTGPATGLECAADWAGILSLGEQQRLAFARCASSLGSRCVEDSIHSFDHV